MLFPVLVSLLAHRICLGQMVDGIGNEHVNLQIFTAELCHSSIVFLGPLELLKATSTLV